MPRIKGRTGSGSLIDRWSLAPCSWQAWAAGGPTAARSSAATTGVLLADANGSQVVPPSPRGHGTVLVGMASEAARGTNRRWTGYLGDAATHPGPRGFLPETSGQKDV